MSRWPRWTRASCSSPTSSPRRRQSWYFGKRSLGVEIRDFYGQLIDGRNGKRGQIREGGDSDALASRGAPPEIKLVALYSGIVALDADGNATVHLDIPDYNGRLRLMAIAWDAEKVGSGEAGLVVRDPIVVTMAMPRFLAPGDKSQITVSLENISGPAGDYQLAFTAVGGASLGTTTNVKQHLNSGGHAVVRVPLGGERWERPISIWSSPAPTASSSSTAPCSSSGQPSCRWWSAR